MNIFELLVSEKDKWIGGELHATWLNGTKIVRTIKDISIENNEFFVTCGYINFRTYTNNTTYELRENTFGCFARWALQDCLLVMYKKETKSE